MTNTALAKVDAIMSMKAAIEKGRWYSQQIITADAVTKQLLMLQAAIEVKSLLSDDAIAGAKVAAGDELTFKVDRPDYPLDIIRKCISVALVKGIPLVGNHFNILAGNFFCTKEGWKHKLRELGARKPDCLIGDAEDVREKPVGSGGTKKITAYFCGRASCQLNGKNESIVRVKDDVIDGRIVVTAFGKDLEDAMSGLKGKAEARMLKLLYLYLADEPDTEPDDDVDDIASNAIDVSYTKMPDKPSDKYNAACVHIAKATTEQQLFDLLEKAGKYDTEGVLQAGEYQAIQERIEIRGRELRATR